MIDQKLYSVLKVHETGNFTKAASELSLTQPAVSQHILSLEKELGVKIFERHAGSISTTREGELVVQYAKRMMALYANLRKELSSETRHVTSLTVGVTHTAESNQITAALAKYASINSLSIKIQTSTINNLYNMLSNYELDFAIMEGAPADNRWQYLPLDTDSLVLAVSPSHRLAKKDLIRISDVKKEKMILRLPNSNTRNLFVSSLEAKNMSINEFNVILEIDNIATIKDLIRHDYGVSVLAKSVCLDEIRKKKIVCLPIEGFSMVREINVVCEKDFRYPDILQGVINEYLETRRKY